MKKKIISLFLFLISAMLIVFAFPACDAKGAASDKPTLLDIGSEGCEYCQLLEPVLEKLETEYGNVINFLSYEAWYTEEGIQKAKEYGVKSYPTIILLDPSGKEVDRIIGARTYQTYVNAFRKQKWIK